MSAPDNYAAVAEQARALVARADELGKTPDASALFRRAAQLLEENGAAQGDRDHPLQELHQWILFERVAESELW
jgi:hypothetical protein